MISRERLLELAKATREGGDTSMTPHEFSEILDGYISRSPSGRERQEFIERAAIAHSALGARDWTTSDPGECFMWAEALWEEREKRRNSGAK